MMAEMRYLDLHRFRELAEAYGSVIERWPEAVRVEAVRLAQQPAGRAILEDAAGLDSRLDLWRTEAPSATLRSQVERCVPSRPVGLVRPARLWWSAVGIASALAGAAAGTMAAATVVPADRGMPINTTAFGDIPGSEK